MIDFERAREAMVDNQLRTAGITDHRLLQVMGEVPRERFVPADRRPFAYTDEVQPITAVEPRRYLSAPAPFARLVQLADIEHTDRLLDVGSGNGYSAAVLGRLASHVVGVENDAALAAQARTNLGALGSANVSLVEGPLETSGKSAGPYDVIFLEGVVTMVPETFFAQLKPEGRLVAAVAEAGRPAVAHVFARSGKGIAARAEFDARLPPLATARLPDAFVF